MVTGFSNNVHQAFNSLSEALEFMRLYKIARRREESPEGSEASTTESSNVVEEEEHDSN